MNMALVAISYLIGTFPSAYLAGRWLGKMDIRQVGDCNPGASNISRHIGSGAGMMVLLSDIAKGALAVSLARIFSTETVALFCGVAVVAGHNWPVFFRFRGGRGLSTTIGVMLALVTLPMLIVSLPGLFILLSNLMLTGLVMWIPLPLLEWIFGISGVVIIYSLALPCLSGILHFVTTRHFSEEQKKEALCW
jgi:glycerol-3-phosphate acyltransferase PlsY